MGRLRFLVVLFVIVAAGCSSGDHAPLEDVALQGRILRADGTPLANTGIYVESVKPSHLLTGEKKTRFTATTDARGRYRFVFPKAHEVGKQTNTDYFLHASSGNLRVSYELELKDAVHEAPDLTFWDPELLVGSSGGDYAYRLTELPGGYTSVSAMVGDTELSHYDYGTINGRTVEDVPLLLVPHAFADVGANGTVYHQRFVGTGVPFRGTHVPVSRGATCVATQRDKSTRDCAGLTDGELTKKPIPMDCCDAVVIDLGRVRSMDDIAANDCTCAIEVSTDKVTWLDFRFGSSPKPPGRYVRITSASLETLTEVSVWPA